MATLAPRANGCPAAAQDVKAGGEGGRNAEGRGRKSPHNLASREGLLLVTYSLYCSQTGEIHYLCLSSAPALLAYWSER